MVGPIGRSRKPVGAPKVQFLHGGYDYPVIAVFPVSRGIDAGLHPILCSNLFQEDCRLTLKQFSCPVVPHDGRRLPVLSHRHDVPQRNLSATSFSDET